MNTVYCFENLINGKKYIGSTIIDPKIRYRQHIYNSTHENDRHYKYPLYCAFRKYGIDNFSFTVLESLDCTEEEIRKIEHDYIVKYDTVVPNGYNQTEDTIHPINDQKTYEKIRETKREKALQVAEVDDHYNVIQVWRSIIDCVEQDNSLNERKVAAVCRGERLTTCGRMFCWLDENNKVIIPEYHRDEYKGAPGTTQIQSSSREIVKIDLHTKEILQTYPTVALAARENNCDPSAITKVCRGKRNKCGGFGWKYSDEL